MRKCSYIYFIICALLASGVTALAQTAYYVATNGDDDAHTGTGGWDNAVKTISNGVRLASAASGNLVLVSNGFYQVSTQINLTTTITVQGFGNRESVIVDGGGATRCFYMNHTGAVLSTITITNGQANGDAYAGSSSTWGSGGGCYLSQGTMTNCIVNNCIAVTNGGGVYLRDSGTIKNSIIAGNSAQNTLFHEGGGGVFFASDATMEDCLISNNIAVTSGGGINIYGAGGTLRNCMIIGNASAHAGGVYVYYKCLISNCVFASNLATNDGGGGVYFRNRSSSSYGLVVDCVISNNRAQTSATLGGGGIYIHTLPTNDTIRNCLITHNQADGLGGGVQFAGVQSNNCLVNCTIVNNWAGTCGGGVWLDNCIVNANTRHTTNLLNCIVYDNSAGTEYPDVYVKTTASVSYCCLSKTGAKDGYASGINNVTNDPGFADTNNWNCRLTANSPCLNTGLNQPWMTGDVDLEGRRRLDRFSGLADMGCYEFLPLGSLYGFR